MNDLSMGFKQTMLQRLQSIEVYPGTGQPAVEKEKQTTDFSINRILGEKSEKRLKATVSKTRTQPTPFGATDILDLSKSATSTNENLIAPPQAYRNLHPYAFQTDFFAAAAATANATKFYAHLFPHMFPAYTSAHLNMFNATSSTASAYQKRYFAPYIVNSANLPAASTPTHHISPSEKSRTPLCPRVDCAECRTFYKQYPCKSPSFACLPNTNLVGGKSAQELLLNSSAISMTTITNMNLTSSAAKSFKINTIANAVSANALPTNAEEISYKCRICDKVFGCSQTLQAHEKTHKSPRYECTECGKGFSQLRNYKYHLSVHRGTFEFAAKCPECGKTFNDKGYLSSHMKIHRNKKEYECPYCPKSFNQRVAFNMHVRIHTGVKPHKCTECGKRFSRKMLLKQHMRTHSGEKPYQCSVCGKSFADRSNMTLHHRLHSGIKPFNCPICPKAFTKKHHLKTHLNYHTGCKPYVCPHPNCNQAFTQSSNMRTHAKKCQFRPQQLTFASPAENTAATSSPSSQVSGSIARPRFTAPHMGMPTHMTAAVGFPPTQQPLLSTVRPF